jgi:hypothetical protein
LRQAVAMAKRERENQLRPIAEEKHALPFFLCQPRERRAIGRRELQRRPRRFDVGRKLVRRSCQKSYLSANCMRRGLPAENAFP